MVLKTGVIIERKEGQVVEAGEFFVGFRQLRNNSWY